MSMYKFLANACFSAGVVSCGVSFSLRPARIDSGKLARNAGTLKNGKVPLPNFGSGVPTGIVEVEDDARSGTRLNRIKSQLSVVNMNRRRKAFIGSTDRSNKDGASILSRVERLLESM